MKKNFLFWPGRGKSQKVLSNFIKLIGEVYEVSVFPFEYDIGSQPFTLDSIWYKWLKENRFDWWCGISLGASLLYVMSSLCQEITPERITMINAFNSRSLLANEKGFSMEGQWNIDLSNYTSYVNKFEVVISVFDEKIPMHHSIEILNSTFSELKRLIFVDSNHCIQNEVVENELANLLLEETYGGKDNRFNKYCHIYQ